MKRLFAIALLALVGVTGTFAHTNHPVPLEPHHKNGVSDDHRYDNLELLCPNCHSQTDTYCGKNKKKKNI